MEFFSQLIVFTLLASCAYGQDECQRGGCYPATGDLLVGREERLTASSTCGLNGQEKYCIVSYLKERTSDKCFLCDSTPAVDQNRDGYKNSHLPKYMVTRRPSERLATWWQAANGKQDVTITLDLEAEFIFTHLILTFKTFRPRAMYVERSWDYGKRWSVYRYFAEDCKRSFPNIPRGPRRQIDDVICEQRYSSVEPSTKGEVVMKVLDPINGRKEDPYSVKIQNLLKLTNLKIVLKELHTLGDDIIGDSTEVNRKYYYSIYEMVVRGSCSCYGHAEQCIPFKGDPTNVDMVYGKCNCTHNTKGRNCEQCMDEYNDQPWKPAYKDRIHKCKKCNCNSHSRKCHFDVAVYNATNGVSGGVCEDCDDNTTGRQCEQCKPLFYRDPFKNIFDKDVCKPCDCDPSGSFGGGECETITDPGTMNRLGEVGTVAGRCICKKNVAGVRCDQCKDGFWQLLESNSEGCQSCGCDKQGTVAKDTCDPNTGKCRCKRFVTGATCNKCAARFWDMGSTKDGCRPCECDLGGSFSDICDDITGDCSCRPNIIGRQCDQVRPGFYFSTFDQNLFEGEDAVPIEGKTKVIRRIMEAGNTKSFTGDGFVEVQEGSKIAFVDVNVPYTGEYTIVIRYEVQGVGNWNDVRMRVSRVDGLEFGSDTGRCPKTQETDKYFYPKFLGSEIVVKVTPTICLEKGVMYRIQIDFQSFDGPNISGVTLVDSLLLMPKTDDLRIFQGRDGDERRRIFEKLNCRDYYLKPVDKSKVPDECKKFQFSISAETNNGAIACQCDPVGTRPEGGSNTLTCSAPGGQCPCRPGVVGRRCDRCAAGYYGFGPLGCTACDCNKIGSSSLFCDESTGQCSCKADLQGRKCDSCPPNYYGFPKCKPCKCSGHSSTCDPRTGRCTDCLHNTAGPNCDRCADGYYGDAKMGTPKDCSKCQCPGGSGGNQFADTCRLDNSNQLICIDCLPGYTGRQCQKCDDGYYGNPLVAGGKCIKCNCNGNIDPFADGKCDAVNGNCFNCLKNTAGPNCHICKPGYFGDAKEQSCQSCVCDKRGTDPKEKGVCNRITGQCPCLQNVIGIRCDQCQPGFYKISSGKGCQACGCDKNGSLEGSCNLLDGQCKCRVGFGGRDCSQCENLYWGNPQPGPGEQGCRPCQCNPTGSLDTQCDRTSGICKCKPNIIGDNCDMCAPRTSGVMPTCEDCHPCNTAWEDIITALEKNITSLIGNDSTVGPITNYNAEVAKLRKLMNELEDMLKNGKVTKAEVDQVRERTNKLREDMEVLQDRANAYTKRVNKTKDRTTEAIKKLDEFDQQTTKLKKDLDSLTKNATNVVESNVAGALNSTQESNKRSKAATKVVKSHVPDKDKNKDKEKTTVEKSKAKRRPIKKEFDLGKTDPPTRPFSEITAENDEIVKNLTTAVDEIELELKRLNGRLCGIKNDGSPCGGCTSVGCETCGEGCTGLVDQGVRKLAQDAVVKAQEAKNAFEKKQATAAEILEKVKEAAAAVAEAKKKSDEAEMKTGNAKKQGEVVRDRMKKIIEDINGFLGTVFNKPNKTIELATETLKLNLTLKPEAIKNLAKEIRELVKGLKDVDSILNDTKKDLNLANDLKKKALEAKKRALNVMAKADDVLDRLKKAQETQNNTRTLIKKANKDIDDAVNLVKKVQNSQLQIRNDLTNAEQALGPIQGKAKEAEQLFVKNKKDLDDTMVKVDKTDKLVKQAKDLKDQVETKFDDAQKKISDKEKLLDELRKRVKALGGRAIKLFETSELQMNTLDILHKRYLRNEERIKDLQDELRKMANQEIQIRDKMDVLLDCHAGCNPLNVKFCPELDNM